MSGTISQSLTAGAFYWLCINTNGGGTLLDGVGVANVFNFLGISSGFIGQVGLTVAQSYGAFPGTFPSGATPITSGSANLIGVHYSA